MTDQFTTSTTKIDQTIDTKETAGTIRKREREKNKKEKTLSSKLRMKAKKNK